MLAPLDEKQVESMTRVERGTTVTIIVVINPGSGFVSYLHVY